MIYSFRRSGWKSFRVIIGLFIVPVLIMFTTFSSDNWFMSAIMIFAVVSIFAKPWELFTKITINPKGIECKGLSTTYFYYWESIQSVDIFYAPKIKRNYGAIDLETDTFSSDDSGYGEKRIFISTEQIASPGWFHFLGENYLDFQYDEKAWELIVFYTDKKDKPASSYL